MPGELKPKQKRRFKRIHALAGRLLRPPSSKLGLLGLVLAVAGIGSVVTAAGFFSLHYSESASFCSKCHTMTPQIKAYKTSPHRDVACAECHVGPGIKGFVKAKINGSKQTVQIITGKYPKPIPAPDHALLPPVKDTCMECHSLEALTKNGGPMKIVLRQRFREDKSNTRDTVAVVVRPAGLGNGGTRGAHWHVDEKVEFTSADEHSRKIDWIGVTLKDGTKKEFIARAKVDVSSNAQLDIKRLKRDGRTRRMDCIECHNRAGHEVPTPERAIDESIAAGKISRKLPYIKREAVSRLSANYPSQAVADQRIAAIRKTYVAKYPLVRKRAVDQAVDELQRLYRLVATPDMKTVAATYPSNLGHQTSPGCFRCHDGAHYQVKKGRVLNKTIPWACTTCHTFPQAGKKVESVALLGKPADHKDSLWVFNHKSSVGNLDPAGTTCAACHRKSYCSNCHKSGATKVKHDEMLYQHPTALEKSGARACAYCHQTASCARCHKGNVLKSKKPYRHSYLELQRNQR